MGADVTAGYGGSRVKRRVTTGSEAFVLLSVFTRHRNYFLETLGKSNAPECKTHSSALLDLFDKATSFPDLESSILGRKREEPGNEFGVYYYQLSVNNGINTF